MKETNLKATDLATFLKWVSIATFKRDGEYIMKEAGVSINELELAEYFIETKSEYDIYLKIKNLKKKKNETT